MFQLISFITYHVDNPYYRINSKVPHEIRNYLGCDFGLNNIKEQNTEVCQENKC